MAIVCGTDFTDRGVRAATIAGGIARRLHESLVLVHALEVATVGYVAGEPVVLPLPGWTSSRHRAAEAHADEGLGQEVRRLREFGIEVTPILTIGEPAAELEEIAEEEGAPLIVCASNERNALGRLIFGSVADRLLHNCGVPFLVLREDMTSFERWALGRGTLDIMVGLDEAGMIQVASLARLFSLAGDCTFQYEHVVQLPRQGHARAGKDQLERMAYRAEFPPALPLTNLSSRTRIGEPGTELSLDADLTAAGLLLVGHSSLRENGGSVAADILHGIHCPIAVAPFARSEAAG